MSRRSVSAILPLIAAALVSNAEARAELHNAQVSGVRIANAAAGRTYDLVRVPGPGKFVWADVHADGVDVLGYATILVDGVAVIDADFSGSPIATLDSRHRMQQLTHTQPGQGLVSTKFVPPQAIAFRKSLVIKVKLLHDSATPQAIGARAMTGEYLG